MTTFPEAHRAEARSHCLLENQTNQQPAEFGATKPGLRLLGWTSMYILYSMMASLTGSFSHSQNLRFKALQKIASLSTSSSKSTKADLLRLSQACSGNEAPNDTREGIPLSQIPIVRGRPC